MEEAEDIKDVDDVEDLDDVPEEDFNEVEEAEDIKDVADVEERGEVEEVDELPPPHVAGHVVFVSTHCQSPFGQHTSVKEHGSGAASHISWTSRLEERDPPVISPRTTSPAPLNGAAKK